MKIKRGTVEAPPMPEVSGPAKVESNVSDSETDEQLIERLEKNTVNNSKALQEMFFNGIPSL